MHCNCVGQQVAANLWVCHNMAMSVRKAVGHPLPMPVDLMAMTSHCSHHGMTVDAMKPHVNDLNVIAPHDSARDGSWKSINSFGMMAHEKNHVAAMVP